MLNAKTTILIDLLNHLDNLSFNLLVNSYFKIEIFKYSNGLLYPICKPFEYKYNINTILDLEINNLYDNIEWLPLDVNKQTEDIIILYWIISVHTRFELIYPRLTIEYITYYANEPT